MSAVILILLGSIWALWALYVFTMGCYRAYLSGRLSGISKVMAYPIVAVAYSVDILVNVTVATIIFLDPPREFMLTSRLRRYIKSSTDWRFVTAKYICDNLLDIFDPKDYHC